MTPAGRAAHLALCHVRLHIFGRPWRDQGKKFRKCASCKRREIFLGQGWTEMVKLPPDGSALKLEPPAEPREEQRTGSQETYDDEDGTRHIFEPGTRRIPPPSPETHSCAKHGYAGPSPCAFCDGEAREAERIRGGLG